MTIKQQGGIFGRNPTFNDVEVNSLGIGAPASSSVDLEINASVPRFQLTDADNSAYTQFLFNTGSFAVDVDPTEAGGSSKFTVDVDNVRHLELNSSGNLTLETGNLVIGTSGKGIDFSATSGTGTSELFDDYEEGTWTPVLVGGTTAGTGTYSQQDGVYTKVGNLVTVSCYLAWNAHTGTGTMTITGLPFSGVGSSIDVQPGATYAQRVDAGTNATQMVARIAGTGSSILLHGFVNDSLKTDTQVNSDGSGSQLGITITYRTT